MKHRLLAAAVWAFVALLVRSSHAWELSQARRAPASGRPVAILSGTHAVCKAVGAELTPAWWMALLEPSLKVPGLSSLAWREPANAPPLDELVGSEETTVDFDNDGKLDRVFARSFEDRYMNGSVLLVQSGRSATRLDIGAEPLNDNAWFIPCQLDTRTIPLKGCPLFSQDNDEAGFRIQGRTAKEQIVLRARYSTVTPFRFDDVTYMLVTGNSDDTMNVGAVLKPLPAHQYAPMCVLRR